MSKWKIAWRSIQQRGLASSLTGLSMALGVMLVVTVLVVHSFVTDAFMSSNGLGYNLVVGAKGGKLQLVLNTVYYLSQPVENIPYSYYKEFRDGRFKMFTSIAVPCCLGDYYQEFRVVGTTPAMFNDLVYGNGQKYRFASGKNFAADEYFTGVIGATVAAKTGLKVGDTFSPSHAAPDGHEHDPFTVVGVLAPTGTPNDRALFINIEGFYLLDDHAKPVETEKHEHGEKDDHAHEHGKEAHAQDKDGASVGKDHDHEGHDHAHEGHDPGHDHAHQHREPLPEDQREVTAILVRTTHDAYSMSLRTAINEGQVAQAVLPIAEITTLFTLFVKPLEYVLLGLTTMIVIVSGIGILVSIYNSMSDRRHEIAVMRALGAGRQTVMLIVLFESILLSLAGGAFGWLLGHALIAGLGPWVSQYTGAAIGALRFSALELIIIPSLIVLASLVGYLPAVAAYRTDVAKSL